MRNIKTLCRRIAAMAIAVAMVLGAVALLASMTGRSFADEDLSQYNFTTGQLDPVFYAATYPDLKNIANDPLALFEHYADHGMAEGRIPYAGAQPGEAINGYIGINTSVAATATVVDQTGTATASGDYVYDLSDWTPEQLALLAQKQAEFDASGLCKKGWTESQVKDAILSLKNVYPEGYKIGNCELGAGTIAAALYGDDMYWLVGYDKNGERVYPMGFVCCGDTKRRNSGEGNIYDIKSGDMLYTIGGSGTGHVSVVISHDDEGVTVVSSNRGKDEKFHWGKKISWSELENGGKTIYQQQNKWTKITHYNY